MRNRIELNHSIHRKNQLITEIRDVALSEIGLNNLNCDLMTKFEWDVNEILTKLTLLYGGDKTHVEYMYDPFYGDHLFIASSAKIAKGRISDYKVALRKENTVLTYLWVKGGVIFKINRRYYPLSGSDKVMSINVPLSTIFSGSKFIKSVYDDRRVNDTKEIWDLDVASIKTSIRNLVELLNTDFRLFWYRQKFSPQDALYIVERLMECTHALMCLVEVNNNHTVFKSRAISDDVALEILDMALGRFHDNLNPVEFTELAIHMAGKLADRLVTEEYQHLFRGFTKS